MELKNSDLQAVVAFAADCARPALRIFRELYPSDLRLESAVLAAEAFAAGTPRSKQLRDAAWTALRVAKVEGAKGQEAAAEAALSAMMAAGSAFLHPIYQPDQVKHILGAAAHCAAAFELNAGRNPIVGEEWVARAKNIATPALADVLCRFPAAPSGGRRVGELIRMLDRELRLRCIRGI